jgi:hypothetical protein
MQPVMEIKPKAFRYIMTYGWLYKELKLGTAVQSINEHIA